ncbi:hypothetical protein QCA50_011849 [Cerrena zonata]|uniref:F-box domain-containing protein n=1 Tax=Cerrena zonata TaxID=2478898 RepID=A0AAW0G3P0_9APHY
MLSQELPQELVENVLDCLDSDTVSLKASSLVCRSWRFRSQYHLHRVLNLRSDCNIKLIQDRLTSFPAIAGYVTCLKLDLSGFTPCLWNTLVPVLQLLPYIDSIAFVCKDMCKLRPEVTNFLAQNYSSLNALTLSNIIFTNFTELANLLNCFPHLLNLEIKNVYWGTYRKSHVPIPKPCIHALSLAYCTEQAALLEWLLCENDEGQTAVIPFVDLKWKEDIETLENLATRIGNGQGKVTYVCSAFVRYTSGDYWK